MKHFRINSNTFTLHGLHPILKIVPGTISVESRIRVLSNFPKLRSEINDTDIILSLRTKWNGLQHL